jgi:hypothetical protein
MKITLEPMYCKLILSQTGSSFTISTEEDGIPFGLVNRAEKMRKYALMKQLIFRKNVQSGENIHKI